MRREPITVTPDDTLAHALELTRRHRIRHLPVVATSGALAGIVSDRDFRLAMPSPLLERGEGESDFLRATPIAAIMTREVVSVSPTDTVEDASRLLCRHRIGALPVVDEAGRLVGILSETDVLLAFVQLFYGAEPSSRLEVSLQHRPGELARVVRILGEELALNIVSVMVPPLVREGRKTAIVHLATIDPRHAVEALEAAGFEVGWPSLDSDLRSMERGPTG